jgi:hypothetical protein
LTRAYNGATPTPILSPLERPFNRHSERASRLAVTREEPGDDRQEWRALHPTAAAREG